MSVSLSVDGPGDAELISAVRGGDVDAYGELFARHVDAARRLARQLAGPADADDLVSDAFTKVLTVLQRGGGPDLAFRAYLLTAVRRLHVDRIRAGSRLRPVDDLAPFDPGLPFHDTAVEGFDNAAAARAFASLPERWQMVLWHTEVEQQKPADIAPLLGMSANSVSALAYRAREGLRQAFLSQHATDPDDVDCAWTRDHLGAYVRGGLSRRDSARVDDHLAACRACAAVYLELTEVNSGLAALLAPLLLGSAGAGYLSSTSGGSGALSAGFAAAKSWVAAHASLTAVGGMAVTATALAAVYGVSHLPHHNTAELGSAQTLGRPAAASSLPSNGPHHHGTTQGRTKPGRSHHLPSADKGLRPSPSRAPGSTAPTANDSAPPPATSTGPTTGPTSGPTTGPTSGPTSGPSSSPPSTGPTTTPHRSVTFTSTPPSDPTFGTRYHVRAEGGSGQITFSVDSATTNHACTMLKPHVVLFQHAGKCVVAAADDGKVASRALRAAHDATQKIHVPREAQTVRITSTPDNPVVAGPTYTLAADPGVTKNPVTYAADGGCAVSGSIVSFEHATPCTITAHEDGNSDYHAATDTQTFLVGKGSQTITFIPTLTAATGTTVPLTATSTSGLAVSFDVDPPAPTNTTCHMVDQSTVSFDQKGTCVVTADQAGNNDYNAADTVRQSIDVQEAVHAVMGVTASSSPSSGKGQVRVVADVTGLPPGSKASLTISIPSSANVKPDDGVICDSSTDDASKIRTFVCAVTTSVDQTFGFTITVNKARPLMIFDLEPVPPLVLDPGSVTDAELRLVAGETTTTQRSFARRTQS